MKIAICAPANIHVLATFCNQETDALPPGLGSTATTPLIIELLRRGHEITLFTLSNGLDHEMTLNWRNLRIRVGSSRQHGAARSFYRPEVRYLRRAILEEAPAFVHAHWTYEFAWGALATHIPTLVTIHDLPWNVLRYFRDRSRLVRLLMAYSVAVRCKHYTAVSEDAARHFRRFLRPSAQIEVIPNFISEDILDYFGNVERFDGYAFSTTSFIYATILQGWSARKNGTVALRAYAAVRKSLPQARLLMIGTDYGCGGLANEWARKQRLDEGVTFVGPMANMDMLRRLRTEVDVLVHPSLDEALSMTVIEAMALGKPVIAGLSTPGMRQALDDGRAGILVDVRNPEAVAAEMKRLHLDRRYRGQVTRDGYHRARDIYRSALVIPQYERIYRSMIPLLTGF